MFDLRAIQKAIHLEKVGGWLFSSFQHRDPLSESILELDRTSKNTRPWYYIVYPEGSPTKIVHAIEKGILHHLPGETFLYDSRNTLIQLFQREVFPKAQRLACQFSPTLRILSFLDHGTALLLEECGFSLVSAASLLQRFRGVLSDEMVKAHKRATMHLYEIVERTWGFISQQITHGYSLYEGEVQQYILQELENRKLISHSPPIVACGTHSGNPHYSPQGNGSPLEPNQVIQLDLWAKEEGEFGTYADISWVGFTGATPPSSLTDVFSTLTEARDRTIRYIQQRLESGRTVSGKEVDAFCRSFLSEAGFGQALKHRTGHGIDRELHGFGVNLDSVEFPDDRYLLEGSCFSIEPGLYFQDFGMRTEVNAYVWEGQLHVTGPFRQTTLLKF
ncbi:MAG: aminopeptidase P family protein [Spirochaetes bacterium]|nr:aminopeptidase P family protein [Spirochaetota bacterium]